MEPEWRREPSPIWRVSKGRWSGGEGGGGWRWEGEEVGNKRAGTDEGVVVVEGNNIYKKK